MKYRKISFIFSIVLLLGLFSDAAAGDTVPNAADKHIFKASEAWNESDSGDDIWKWESYTDMGRTYTELTVYNSARGKFGMDPENPVTENVPTGGGWCGGSAWNYAAVGQYWMIPLVKTTGTDENTRKQYGVCKSFTAPRDGNVTLSTENGKIYGGAKEKNSANSPAYIRVTKNGEQIWPEGNAQYQIPFDTIPIQVISFKPVSLDVSAGDIIRFEAYNGDGSAGYSKYVYWAPVVSYNYLPDSIQPSELYGVPAEQVFTLTFPDLLCSMGAGNINISSQEEEASVKTFSQNGESISFDFEGLKGETTYNVTVSGIEILGGDGTKHSFSFSFTTGYMYENPVYEADDAWSATTNNHEVWTWLYKNNLTKDTLTPYVKYTLTAKNSTKDYVAPIKDENGNYDYTYVGQSADVTEIFCDSQSNAYMRNSIGRYWARLSVGTSTEPMQSKDNEIVKQFTAPETGRVLISCRDMDGLARIYDRKLTASNPYGAVIKIIKRSSDDKEETLLWRHDFKYTSATVPESGVAVLDFDALEADIKKGEKLWFVISGELAQSAYAKQVFWNPVVSYESVLPNLISTDPENNTENIVPNYVHKITFDHNINLPSANDIEVNGGAVPKDIYIENGNTLCITYDKLDEYTNYDVKLKNITVEYAESQNENIYEYSFKTGSFVELGDIKISGGALKKGDNTISVNINNAKGTEKPYGAVLAAFICRGTPKEYEVTSVKYVYRNDIVENDRLSLDFHLEQKEGCFVKILLAESITSARALLPLIIYN